MVNTFTLMRPFIHLLPPETAHNLGLCALKRRLLPSAPLTHFPELETKAFGLSFANPIGLAAGFDKNAVAIDALLRQGFGFVEAGTVTPRPQAGNPEPRLFRLPEDKAVINRLGFNNQGLTAFVEHYKKRDQSLGIAGANIGRNKDTTDAVTDYVLGLKALYPYADYITVNISSPNTQGLRALQQREALTKLLGTLQKTRQDCREAYSRYVPLLLKIAPDLETGEMEDIADVVQAHNIDGMIISNTTIQRPALTSKYHTQETGGLSGKPLFDLSTERLKQMYKLTSGTIPLIGVGGISNAADAYRKIRAGATLLQLYTALVYEGFSAVRTIERELVSLLKNDGFSSIEQAVGVDVAG